jgi:acyl-coenzyme A thioesterase PaaI-like protein
MTNHQEEGAKKQSRVVPFSADERLSSCFGCGGNNPLGLKLNFHWDGKTAQAEFTPPRFYQSWPDIIHGGIITTMLDEAMGHATRFSGISDFLTAAIQVNFKRPALVGKPLVITGSIIGKEGRSIEAEAMVTLPDGTLVAEGKATQVIIEPQGEDTSSKEEEL